MSKSKHKNTCANSTAPDKSMEREIADVVMHECDINTENTPYKNIAKYKMVTKDDDNGTFSSGRS